MYQSMNPLFIKYFCADKVFPERTTLDLWSGGIESREEWFVDNHTYWGSNTDLKIRNHEHEEE